MQNVNSVIVKYSLNSVTFDLSVSSIRARDSVSKELLPPSVSFTFIGLAVRFVTDKTGALAASSNIPVIHLKVFSGPPRSLTRQHQLILFLK
ncbi:hypothetical protein PNOK_0249300 [Pyrrhoderma noxium]|uniref:Uncharacterized protein n=1 Tax=Pyrrhoderma noxium TaxID=2282107 RepID=A0A286USH4_9AGAM|nr:hypothetical protein PNOK_0249300 [Pyrrhoderma noxium]